MILEAETGLASAQQVVMLGGKVVAGDESTLGQLGFENDCLVIMERRLAPRTGTGTAPSRAPGQPDPIEVNPDGSAKHPELLMDVLSRLPDDEMRFPPEVRNAVKSRDIEALQTSLRGLRAEAQKRQEEEDRFMRLAAEDPMNIEVQQRLEEIIRQKNVEENFEKAMEYHPEAFAAVSMLYISVTVNGVKQPAFVDSGAQMSIMGKSTAEKCGLLRLMDTRFRGKAVGVGTGTILGKVHMAPMEIGGHHIPVSITIMEQDGMEFLFGLDNLKRYQCSIDLQKNVLRFPGLDNGRQLEMPFLQEHEIKKSGVSNIIDQPDMVNDTKKQKQEGEVEGEAAAAAPVPATAPAAATVPATASAPFPESKISLLMNLGFQREAVIQALTAANGNEEIAAALLFS